MARYYLVGVANVFYHAPVTDNIIFQAKTMTNTAVDIKISNTKINAGYGNKLQLIYFHTPELDLTLEEAQFNLGMIAATTGSTINTGGKIWTEENVTLGAGGTGTVDGTPIVSPDVTSTIYGWVTDSNDVVTKVTFSGKNFTLSGGSENEVVTVRYYEQNNNVSQMDIGANFIPAKGRLVMEAQLASSDSGEANDSTIIGKVQFEIPNCQLDGTANLAMSSSGVSKTPLKAMALSKTKDSNEIYATISRIDNNAHWYDNVQLLALEDDKITLSTGETATLVVWAIPNQGSAFLAPTADVTFTSGNSSTASVNSSGIVSFVASGSTTVNVKITSKTSVETNADVTCS
jgi:hypothetical protein